MPERPKAIAFDVDWESLASLRQAFPEWEVEVKDGATPGSLAQHEFAEAADLLILGARADAVATLGLCRGLRDQVGRGQTPLLVLVPPGQEALVRAALEAGADRCLVLPVHPKELLSMVSRVRAGSWPGRHTLDLDRVQGEDPWRDDGGEA
jgi:DNA-binding response OmpR family regulator